MGGRIAIGLQGPDRERLDLLYPTWGERAGLTCTLLARDAYGLIVRARELGEPRVVRLCEVAQSAELRAEVASIPGYDVSGAGDIRYDA